MTQPSFSLDEFKKTHKVCNRDCKCHQGARYDQIECICPFWCGDERL